MSTREKLCPHCGGPISIRNPTGKCDHLFYPESCSVCKKMEERRVNEAKLGISYEDLTKIAEAVHAGSGAVHGGYAYHLAWAWIYADPENRDLLFPAWSTYVAKYGLEKLLK